MRGLFYRINIIAALLAAPLFGQAVPYVATPENVVDRLLKLGHVTSHDIVYDLGCGDGRIVIAAAKEYGARGIGIDIDPLRIKEAIYGAQQASVTDKTTFIVNDIFKSKFADATVVYLYMLPEFNIKLRPRLLSELKPGTRILAYTFGLGDWKPDYDESSGVAGYDMYIWIVPAKVDGVWDCQLPTPHGPRKAVLRLKQKYQQIAGTVLIDGVSYPMIDTHLTGYEMTFAMDLPGSPDLQQYTLDMSNPQPQPTTKPTTQKTPSEKPGSGSAD